MGRFRRTVWTFYHVCINVSEAERVPSNDLIADSSLKNVWKWGSLSAIKVSLVGWLLCICLSSIMIYALCVPRPSPYFGVNKQSSAFVRTLDSLRAVRRVTTVTIHTDSVAGNAWVALWEVISLVIRNNLWFFFLSYLFFIESLEIKNQPSGSWRSHEAPCDHLFF